MTVNLYLRSKNDDVTCDLSRAYDLSIYKGTNPVNVESDTTVSETFEPIASWDMNTSGINSGQHQPYTGSVFIASVTPHIKLRYRIELLTFFCTLSEKTNYSEETTQAGKLTAYMLMIGPPPVLFQSRLRLTLEGATTDITQGPQKCTIKTNHAHSYVGAPWNEPPQAAARQTIANTTHVNRGQASR